MSILMDPWTPTQRRILSLLADGLAHSREDIRRCLADELSALSNIQPHLSLIRKRLRAAAQDIVCVIVNRRICYRHVRLLAPAAE